MNDDLLKVLVPAVIGLLGTVFGLWLGHRRWASELGMNKRSAFDFKRHLAYLQLWDVVESAHIKFEVAFCDLKFWTWRQAVCAVCLLSSSMRFSTRSVTTKHIRSRDCSMSQLHSCMASRNEMCKSQMPD